MESIKKDGDLIDWMKVTNTLKTNIRKLFCWVLVASWIYHTVIWVKNGINNQLLWPEKMNKLKTQLNTEIQLIWWVYKNWEIIEYIDKTNT